MAITSNNVQNVRFLRNGTLFGTRELAKNALTGFTLTDEQDGTAILARYSTNGVPAVKTLVGFVYKNSGTASVTVFDVDDAGTDAKAYVDSLVGTGVTTANTVTQQLQVLSGDSATAGSGDTSVAGAKKYTDGKLDALDLATVAETGKPIIAVKQEDGLVSASAGTIDAEFVNYAGTTGHVATTVEAAIDDIYYVIDNLDYTDTAVTGSYISKIDFNDGKPTVTREALPDAESVSGDSKVVIDVTQDKGAITATAANLTGVKLDGYAEAAAVADVTSNDTLGEALGKLQKTIHEMDKNADAVAGQVVTTVSEADGVVSETKANVKDLQLGGYVKDTTATGDIASADTINAALSKLENKAAAITINDEDGSISVTQVTSGTDISVNIKSGEHVLAKDGGNGIYTDLDLVKITTGLPETVKERYQLLATDDSQIGVNIDVPKDSHIVSINYITTGEHAQNLEYVYIDASGDTQTTYVDMSELVLETEFASGVTVTDHVAHGVVDPTSETFLTVGADGFKLSGVQDAIDNAVSGLDATVGSQTVATGKHVAVEVVEEDGKLTALTVTESDIASASALTQEIADRQSGDTELSTRLGTGVTTANTATAQLAALSGDPSTADSGDTSVEGAKKYADAKLADVVGDLDATVTDATSGNHVTISIEELDGKLVQSGLTIEENDIASDSALTAEIAARKAVDGVNGDAYTADTNAHYISGASSLYGADQALDTALNAVEGKVDDVADDFISGITVNGSGVTVSDHVAPIVISAATSATTATTTEAITVDTDANGNITLGLAGIDCGTYN